MQLSTDESKLIEQLKVAQTSDEIAKITVALLLACGIYNYQAVAQKMAHFSVTHKVLGG